MDDADQMKGEKTESMKIGHMIALDYIPDISSDLTSIKEHEPVEDDEIESFQDDNSETVDWSDIGCWTSNFQNSRQRDFLVEKGPVRIIDHIFL